MLEPVHLNGERGEQEDSRALEHALSILFGLQGGRGTGNGPNYDLTIIGRGTMVSGWAVLGHGPNRE